MPPAEILVVPALMLADSYLTLWGSKLFGATPTARLAYELNPAMAEDVAQLKLINPRHLLATVAETGAFVSTAYVAPSTIRFFLGLMIGAFGVINGVHITKFLDLKAENTRGVVRGRVKITNRRRLMSGSFRALGMALPLCLVAAFAPSLFTVAAAGALLIAAAPISWRLKSSKEILDALVALGPSACGFCGTDGHTAKRLIEGKCAMICDECVATCVEALAEARAGPTGPAPPPSMDVTKEPAPALQSGTGR